MTCPSCVSPWGTSRSGARRNRPGSGYGSAESGAHDRRVNDRQICAGPSCLRRIALNKGSGAKRSMKSRIPRRDTALSGTVERRVAKLATSPKTSFALSPARRRALRKASAMPSVTGRNARLARERTLFADVDCRDGREDRQEPAPRPAYAIGRHVTTPRRSGVAPVRAIETRAGASRRRARHEGVNDAPFGRGQAVPWNAPRGPAFWLVAGARGFWLLTAGDEVGRLRCGDGHHRRSDRSTFWRLYLSRP